MTPEEPYSQLTDDAFVYRALLRHFWIDEDTGQVKRDAYYLRFDRRETGLSVNVASVYEPKACAARFRNCYGVARLQVGEIRSINLDVLRDSIGHANIIGLPYRESDRLQADRLARLLSRMSKIVWRP
jgi:hypothetical protein